MNNALLPAHDAAGQDARSQVAPDLARSPERLLLAS
jgi:hypothetical protein